MVDYLRTVKVLLPIPRVAGARFQLTNLVFAAICVSLLVLTSCSSPTETDNNVARIEIAPLSGTILVGVSVKLNYVARNGAGAAIANPDIQWTSGNALVASVSANGTVTAIQAGEATIQAKSNGVVGTVVVTTDVPFVTPVLTRLSISSGSLRVQIGSSIAFLASGADARGRQIDAGPVMWHSSTPNVGSISVTGTLLGVTPGTTTVYATSGNVRSDSINISVTSYSLYLDIANVGNDTTFAPGQRVDLFVAERDQNGYRVSPQPNFGFLSSNISVATVRGAIVSDGFGGIATVGSITAVGEGTTTITVTGDGLTATKTVVVTNHGIVNVTYVHAATGLGAITISSNLTNPATVAFGLQQSLSVPAVGFVVSSTGFPQPNYRWFDNPVALSPNRDIALVAIGNTANALLYCLCDFHDAAPSNKAEVRVLMGSNLQGTTGTLTLYLVPSHTAPTVATQLVRSVQLTTVSPFTDAPTGVFDLIFEEQGYVDGIGGIHAAHEIARISGLTAAVSRSTTFVISGDTPATLRAIPIVER